MASYDDVLPGGDNLSDNPPLLDDDNLEDFLGTQLDDDTLEADVPDLDFDVNNYFQSPSPTSTPTPTSEAPAPTQRSLSSLFTRRSKIPENVEIIDLDAMEAEPNGFRAGHAERSSPKVKQEDGEFSDVYMAGHNGRSDATLSNGGGNAASIGTNNEQPEVGLADDHKESAKIKQEDGDVEFLWENLSKELICISDSEDEQRIPISKSYHRGSSAGTSSVESKAATVGKGSSLTSKNQDTILDGKENGTLSGTYPAAEGMANGNPTSSAPIVYEPPTTVDLPGDQIAGITSHNPDVGAPKLKKTLLLTKKPRPALTKERKARIEHFQKLLGERTTGKAVTGDAGTIFQGSRNTETMGKPIERSTANVEDDCADEDPHAWMHGTVEGDEDAAAKFAEIEKRYKAKKRAGKADWQDNVNFLRAENTEKGRLKRLQADFVHAHDDSAQVDMEVEQDDDELFFRESARASSSKRPHASTVEVEDDNVEESDIGHSSSPSKRAKPNKPSKKQSEKMVKEMMLVGIEQELAKERKEASKKKKTATKKPSSKSKGSKPKAKGEGTRKEKGTKKSKGKGAKAAASKPTLLRDVNSLFTSNVYADANANLDKTALPVMTERKKQEALNQLMASVPLEDQRMASREKQHILKATKSLGKYKVRPDGTGRWLFKGMISSLMHHQVQGAGFCVERETGNTRPYGGLIADSMGLGKTIMALAVMVSNPPAPGEFRKTTLIVATHSLVTQWMEEIENHVKPNVLGDVVRYHASSRIAGTSAVSFMSKADVILTTYSEVLRSYPKYKPPKELISHEKKMVWWNDYFQSERGVLHRIPFYRVILDEAQTIKNHRSRTSTACIALDAKHRWAISGTPIQNSVEELYPYFKYLHVPHTGSFEVFKENFCDKESGVSNERLHSFLRQFMIRRTHSDTLFGAPLVTLPKNHERTIVVEFNEVERAIYEIVRMRYIARINTYQQKGELEKRYSNVLTMLLRLRQVTGHIFMLQETIEDLFEVEDVQRLWEATATEVTPSNSQGRNMLVQMRKMIAAKGTSSDPAQSENADAEVPMGDSLGEDDDAEQSRPLVFKFRGILRELSNSSKWDALRERSLCHKCRDVPTDPQITSCLHLYCKECLSAMAIVAAADGEDQTPCLECGNRFSETRPCKGLKELECDDISNSSQDDSPRPRRQRRDPDEDIKWINFEGSVLPSAKTAGLIAQVEQWQKDEPGSKVIIFTQFHTMIKIIIRICQERAWGYCTYHGKMSHEARDRSIREFREMEDRKILIASLKCGGVGLNLTMASRVVCIDLWWNSSVEQQAFCRIFRIGQESETYITRFVVKNTVDEKLQDMQREKMKVIEAAMGDDGRRLGKLSLAELMRLFGPIQEDEGRKGFIIVDDEDEVDSTVPPMPEEDMSGGHSRRRT